MWNLDESSIYTRIHRFEMQEAFTYADTREGHTDKDKRERIRAKAAENFPKDLPKMKWWAFRIYVMKSGHRSFDIENVPKLFVDAFCRKQIQKDESLYKSLGLFDDDTLDYVRVIEVGGERVSDGDMIRVEIFGCK